MPSGPHWPSSTTLCHAPPRLRALGAAAAAGGDAAIGAEGAAAERRRAAAARSGRGARALGADGGASASPAGSRLSRSEMPDAAAAGAARGRRGRGRVADAQLVLGVLALVSERPLDDLRAAARDPLLDLVRIEQEVARLAEGRRRERRGLVLERVPAIIPQRREQQGERRQPDQQLDQAQRREPATPTARRGRRHTRWYSRRGGASSRAADRPNFSRSPRLFERAL